MGRIQLFGINPTFIRVLLQKLRKSRGLYVWKNPYMKILTYLDQITRIRFKQIFHCL